MKNQHFQCFIAFICLFSMPFLQASTLKQEKEKILVTRLLDQAHRIYTESWRVLLSSKSSPLSPMKVLSEQLKKQRWQQTQAVKNQFEIPGLVVANFKERKLKFQFQPAQFRQAFGDSLAILNRQASCEISFDEHERIQTMLCLGLGRSLTKTKHIEFHSIDYNAKSSQVLELKADQYENLLKKQLCSDDEPCLQMKVPQDGKIKIIENHIENKTEVIPEPKSEIKPAEEPSEKSDPGQKRPELPTDRNWENQL